MSRDAAFATAIRSLISSDEDLASIVAVHGMPTRFSRPATFQTLVLLILEQQVSLDSARAAYDRLQAAAPGVAPAGVLGLSDDEMRAIGFSRQKMRYARELARRVTDGLLDPGELGALEDDAVRTALTEVPGIGPWTADVFLMSGLDRPDVWPVGDRALQVATAEALRLDDVPDALELEAIGARWRPYRTAAAQILWHGYLARRKRSVPTGTR